MVAITVPPITRKATYIDTNAAYFTISDGSGAVDSDDHDGVRISASGLIPQGLAVDDFVIVTGICPACLFAHTHIP